MVLKYSFFPQYRIVLEATQLVGFVGIELVLLLDALEEIPGHAHDSCWMTRVILQL
jgi:hypothetical protein